MEMASFSETLDPYESTRRHNSEDDDDDDDDDDDHHHHPRYKNFKCQELFISPGFKCIICIINGI
jgi:hypothetical protein